MISLGVDIGGTSVKVAAWSDQQILWIGRSDMYVRPDRAQLLAAVKQAALPGRGQKIDAVGICVPGIMDEKRGAVTLSVNVPGLVDWPLDDLLGQAIGDGLPAAAILPDSGAAAYDIYTSRKLTGRLLVLVLGTGVGAAVVDPEGLLRVDGDSPGHLGQVDVSLEGEPILGPDGGAGSLEGYIGAAALKQRYGDNFAGALATLDQTAPPLRALARIIRISHALYRPQDVCLAGGIGNALRPLLPAIRDLVLSNLTSIARPNWRLTCGDHDHHAAQGVAKFAASRQDRGR
jgi:glucokinase